MATAMVFAEVLDGKVSEITFELLDVARRTVGDSGTVLAFGVMPESMGSQLGKADAVLLTPSGTDYVPEALAKILAQAIEAKKPDLVLVGSTAVGMDVATYAACKSGYNSIAYVQGIAPEGDGWTAQSLILGGKMVATVSVPQFSVLQVVAGVGNADQGRGEGSPAMEVFTAEPAVRTEFQGFALPESTDVDITKQDVLVSIGRGIGDKDNVEIAEELAGVLGAVVSASRPVVDAGWLPKSRQVGKSGQKVKPKVYLALGISGAPEHLEGMRDAECIIAVNTDPKAPIFDIAHYGVVEDLLDFVPLLSEQLQES
ncbi:electron transfer flavoprotein subunit alpha/FixB family protein [Alicyclobacillus tolerans]|uniref:electron transfer flavoprotein subunit alpha/FixB family protein n=1 Tax=Alicyclobacillus tolerans TaxID=90970 RepID=UPI001F341931|nr:electron transfer flavoprotein subunit alpha/FixB family protein [Alicyclobacillus tolerans]MCF8563627.1 electron transfer flavoprotein subunit alpha/FixB family protein [Alicyclobacillus tolerans]